MKGVELRFPSRWRWLSIGDVASLVTKGESIQWQGEGYVEEGVAFIRTVNVQSSGLDLSTATFVTDETHARMKRSQLRESDLLVSIAGTLGRVCAVPSTALPANINQDLALVRIEDDRIFLPFLLHVLRSSLADFQIEQMRRGAGRHHLNLKQVRNIRFPLPSLSEQHRIVAILDKADALRQKREETIRLSEELLRSAFLETFGDPVTNPMGWPTSPLGELATILGGGTPSRRTPEFFSGKTCWATSKDMTGEWLRDTQEHITEEAIDQSATKLMPAGAVLVVVKSKILLRRLPVLVAAVPTCISQDLKGILPFDQLPPVYLARHLRVGERALLGLARGVNTEGLTLDHLRRYSVMVPPPELVEHYVAFEQRLARLQEVVGGSTCQVASLVGSLAQQALSGELKTGAAPSS